MVDLYGIANCDKVRAARRWLDQHGINYRFHDYTKVGVDSQRLTAWVTALGWETLLNRRGTTWRRLPEAVRANVDRTAAIDLMQQHPTIIRRPLLEVDGKAFLGFDPAGYHEVFGD